MKKLTCSDLGGPDSCDHELTGDTFEELGNNSKTHVMEQLQMGDQAHLAAVEKMKNATPEQQQAWFSEYKQKFDQAPEA